MDAEEGGKVFFNFCAIQTVLGFPPSFFGAEVGRGDGRGGHGGRALVTVLVRLGLAGNGTAERRGDNRENWCSITLLKLIHTSFLHFWPASEQSTCQTSGEMPKCWHPEGVNNNESWTELFTA